MKTCPDDFVTGAHATRMRSSTHSTGDHAVHGHRAICRPCVVFLISTDEVILDYVERSRKKSSAWFVNSGLRSMLEQMATVYRFERNHTGNRFFLNLSR